MLTSESGFRFIVCREALVTVAYLDDTLGGNHYSIGIGSQTNTPKEGDTITPEEAFKLLKADLALRDVTLNKAITVDITQPQWDALASLFFQAGTEALNAVANYYNHGDPDAAIWEYTKWDHGRNPLPTRGHRRRRIREMSLAQDGNYGGIDTFPLYPGNPRLVAPVRTSF